MRLRIARIASHAVARLLGASDAAARPGTACASGFCSSPAVTRPLLDHSVNVSDGPLRPPAVRSRAALASAISLVAMLAGLSLVDSPAQAARIHLLAGSFGKGGSGNGQLSGPEGVALNEATGAVYVVDPGNHRVEYFSASGAYVGKFDGSGLLPGEGSAAPTGRFVEPTAIAIDNSEASPSHGDVYVADTGHNVIDKFSSTGAYIGQVTQVGGEPLSEVRGLATDTAGKLWVCQNKKEFDSFSEGVVNELLSRVTSTGLLFGSVECGFAVDSEDNIYGADFFTGIGKVTSSGAVLIEEFDSLLHEPSGIPFGGVAVDLLNNEVYIVNADAEKAVGRFTSSGGAVETFGGEFLAEGTGVAVDAKTGDVYVSDRADNAVDRFSLQPPAAPVVEGESTSEVSAASATMKAQLNPTGAETSYYFQYGTAPCSTNPGSCIDLPAAPGVAIGGGYDTISASVQATGLSPGTLYYFRVVATNSVGTTAGPDQSLTTQSAGNPLALIDGRGWEMVTPADKHGAGFPSLGNEQGADIQAAASGEAITFGATGPLSDSDPGNRSPEITQVLSRRVTPGRWQSEDLTTPHNEGAAELAVGHSAEYRLFSPELSLGLVEPQGDTPLESTPAGTTPLDSEKTFYLRMPNGKYKAVVNSANVETGAKINGNGVGRGAVAFDGASPDLSHIVLDSTLDLTKPAFKAEGYASLYEWTAGRLKLVSVMPNGKVVAEEEASAALGRGGSGSSGNVRHAVSDSGARVVFESRGHLYLRDTVAEVTVRVDAPEGVENPGEGEALYQTADAEASRVFFESTQRLTSDSSAGYQRPDLYVFELSTPAGVPPVGRLTDLTADKNAGEPADVQGVLDTDEHGHEIFFVANGVLGDAAAHGAKGGDCGRTTQPFKQRCGLYVSRYEAAGARWSSPSLIATLSGEDAPSWGARNDQGGNLKNLTARVSPNGRYLAFMSERSLTGYDNADVASGAPDEEVFLYDADSERLVCASCNPSGARPVGIYERNEFEERLVDYAQTWSRQWIAANIPGWTTSTLSGSLSQSAYLSDEGRLYFNSSDALVPADTNGTEDVYEYEPTGVGGCQPPSYGASVAVAYSSAAGGCVGLISSGLSSDESAFLGASERGGDVFFMTSKSLVSSDLDAAYDVYDAHECTPSSPCASGAASAPPPCSTGDACKPAPTPQSQIFGAPSSETYTGPGNPPAQGPPPAHSGKGPTAAQRRAAALRACKRLRRRRERQSCERLAIRRYRVRSAVRRQAHASVRQGAQARFERAPRGGRP